MLNFYRYPGDAVIHKLWLILVQSAVNFRLILFGVFRPLDRFLNTMESDRFISPKIHALHEKQSYTKDNGASSATYESKTGTTRSPVIRLFDDTDYVTPLTGLMSSGRVLMALF
ncbi:unnamed protein product [Echinostoma caproni]|uniref:Anoctamin n=1 Tax=Echinostoma caproni TaxID=27848 RepID=A0A183B552_9TREM|nr:unnamed protein product [Echinostoma caproni]